MNIKINKKLLFTYKKPPLLIAEISANHNGNKNLFLKHILEAKKSGADLVKIQTYEPEDITVKKLNFQIKNGIWKNTNLWNLYKKTHTPFEWHYEAFKLAKKKKINLFSTPFSIRALKFLDKFDVDLYKISSFEITDYNLIDNIAKRKKPIIISTGMSSVYEIETAKKIINKYHNNLIILYCVSGYPTPANECNINAIQTLKNKFKKNLIGLSDHTNNNYSSLAATVKGVTAIEKHFILSKRIHSEDSSFSIEPKEFKILSNDTKKIFETLGGKKIFLKKSENKNLIFRRSIFASKNIKKGDLFSKENLISLRPQIGKSSSNYFKLLGKKSKISIKELNPIPKNLK